MSDCLVVTQQKYHHQEDTSSEEILSNLIWSSKLLNGAQLLRDDILPDGHVMFMKK